MHAHTVTLESSGSDTACPFQMLQAVKHLMYETFVHNWNRFPCGNDFLAALVGRPASWLVPVGRELSWVGITTSHCVIDSEGNLTGDRIWLEDAVEDDVRPGEYALVPHPDYEEVQVGICTDGSVVMILDAGNAPGVWESYRFAIHKRDLQKLVAGPAVPVSG